MHLREILFCTGSYTSLDRAETSTVAIHSVRQVSAARVILEASHTLTQFHIHQVAVTY